MKDLKQFIRTTILEFLNESKDVDGVKYLPITQAKVSAFTEFDEDKDGNEILIVRIDSIVVPKKIKRYGYWEKGILQYFGLGKKQRCDHDYIRI